jgi:hypothetical protein
MATKEDLDVAKAIAKDDPHTVRAIRWPDRKGKYWCAEHRVGRGYFPIREFGRDYSDGIACVLFARELAECRGVPFVSEVGLNTEDA